MDQLMNQRQNGLQRLQCQFFVSNQLDQLGLCFPLPGATGPAGLGQLPMPGGMPGALSETWEVFAVIPLARTHSCPLYSLYMLLQFIQAFLCSTY